MLFVEMLFILLSLTVFAVFNRYIFSKRKFKKTKAKILLYCKGDKNETDEAVKTSIYIREHFLKNADILVVSDEDVINICEKYGI